MCGVYRVFEAETRRRRGKEAKSGVDDNCRAGRRASNEAKGVKSLPKTFSMGVATDGSAAARAREAKNLEIRQGETGHARRDSRG